MSYNPMDTNPLPHDWSERETGYEETPEFIDEDESESI